MKPIHFAYSKVPNMGDLLNELIMDKLFCVPYVHETNVFHYELTGIGSFMQDLFAGQPSGIKGQVKKLLFQHCPTKCCTWGTGFLQDYSDKLTRVARNDVEFAAVRGKLTKEVIEKITKKQIDPKLGDGGIITPMMVEKTEKKYEIGVIPHWREQDCEPLSYIQKKYPDCHFVNLQNDPIAVIQEISSCDIVLSSSLHGLILCDAYRIPNIRIRLTDAPRGDGFKFDDYYSAYGLTVAAKQISSVEAVPSRNEIIDQYSVSDAMVEKMQSDMYDSLKSYIRDRNP